VVSDFHHSIPNSPYDLDLEPRELALGEREWINT
jgi:hypothetical protein